MGVHKHEARTKADQLIQAIQSLEAAIQSLSQRMGIQPMQTQQEKQK